MTIDGLSAARVVRPESIEELSEFVRNDNGSVIPVGSSTRKDYGNPLRRFDSAIDLTGLHQITEYVPADLTIHVQAGVRLETLNRTLAENNQFLPLDPFEGPEATIGGIAATNAQGPYRSAGCIRDWIIGMKVVEASGAISKTGGRVVKNVTGYDLAKLYTGSIGTLAIITEISLKILARYGRTATAIASVNTVEEAKLLLQRTRASSLQPVSCEWIGRENEIWLRFGEHPKAVEWQLKNLPAADWRVLEGPDEFEAWSALRAKYAKFGPIVLKVIGFPSAAAAIVEEFQPQAWIAHAANGIVLMPISDLAEIRRIREKYRAVIERAPLEVRRQIPTFGLQNAEYELMRKMKLAYDPDNRLNPGKHVDGER
jgi:glycolate oxidase FAD binding subunit